MKRSGNEREGKLAGRRAAAGASIIGPARNASSPQKEILRLRRDNKGLRFISNAEPAPRRPASRGQPTKDPFVHAGAGPAGSWDQGLTGGDRAQREGDEGGTSPGELGAEGDMGAEEPRQVVQIGDHETENSRGGSEKEDLERTGQRVKVRTEPHGKQKTEGLGSERSKACSPAWRPEGLTDMETALRRILDSGTWGPRESSWTCPRL